VISTDRLDEVIGALGRAIAGGDLVYWVCPLVAESETVDLAAAEDRYEQLKGIFGDDVGLVHGKLHGRDKGCRHGTLRQGETRILVSTTVIEVGVDVPQAAVMVIEHAERFGLAQLHQLRGPHRPRVARLHLPPPLQGPPRPDRPGPARDDAPDRGRLPHRRGGPAPARRGRGARHPPVGPARLQARPPRRDGDLLAAARDDARLIVDRDENLESPRGEALRLLLYLFERDAAVRLLRAG
jgi:ATP-dependent DNA helicase RecG